MMYCGNNSLTPVTQPPGTTFPVVRGQSENLVGLLTFQECSRLPDCVVITLHNKSIFFSSVSKYQGVDEGSTDDFEG